jgi:hypothetical protein
MNDKAAATAINQVAEKNTIQKISKLACGIIMPISAQPGCSAEHWSEVRSIIEESILTIDDPKFDARLVSDADDVGVIQKRIVQNIYSAEIVVCDVSCKNSNVMFELGMRLAFDKPTVIIKDDQTDYSFDTGIIEHLTYPRDLRFSKIVSFKKALADKVRATYHASLDPKNSTFLKNFGTFHVASLAQAAASPDQMALEMLSDLQAEVSRLRRDVRQTPGRFKPSSAPRKDKQEATGVLFKLIAEYMAKHALEKAEVLKDDTSFADWVEDTLPAPEYFATKREFISTLNECLEVQDLF